MKVWLAALMGLIQGLTEFLPVSSSGHLVLAQSLLGSDVEHNYLLFDVLLHLGTLISVFICFWPDIKEMIIEFGRMIAELFHGRFDPNVTPARRMLIMLIIATVPMLIVPLFNDYIEAAFTSTLFVGFMLLVTSALLVLTDIQKRRHITAKDASWFDALMVGVMQLIALLPGVSRSGTSICAGTLRGFDRQFAVKFSFLLSIPVIIGANIFTLSDAIGQEISGNVILPYSVGIIIAAVSGIAAIQFVRFLAKRKNYKPIAIYCAAIGIISIAASLIVK